MQIAQKFGGTAQAHGNVIDHALADDESVGQAAVFHAQFDLRFHVIATDDEIPQPRGDDEGEQYGKNGLQPAVID